jgi:hypothetical protein
VRYQLPKAGDAVAAPAAATPRSTSPAPSTSPSETDTVAAAGLNGHVRSGAAR